MRPSVTCRGQYIMSSPIPPPNSAPPPTSLFPPPPPRQLPCLQAGPGKRKFLTVCSHTPWLGLGWGGPEGKWWPLSASPHRPSRFSVPLGIPLSVSTLAPGVPGSPCVGTKTTGMKKGEGPSGDKGPLPGGRGTSSAQGKLQDNGLLGSCS